ncbi:OmpH family outer membrane protein [Novosphingobium colocasiae]|uniref:OmpH family outer membrane protein n=1 Tax=Novosphingobium colocasiae TaxID=1256513 RepID=A0A918PAQ3_9SPHN|nr:OmpH family outer membrane protein [Novosphingobium colocasiae]GGY95347.1 hypothetical protein GCM10011614_07560 [Novosphingobium colocasiae]
MRNSFKTALLAATTLLVLAGTQPALAKDKDKAAPAAAPAATGTIAQGIGIADIEAIVANSSAQQTAATQRQTTYKAQFDAAKAKEDQLNAQLKPLVDKFNADRAAAKPNNALLQQELEQLQGIQNQGKQDIQKILMPVGMSQAYVQEQIEGKLNDAIKNAMTKKGVSLLLAPDSVIAANGGAYYLNQDILNELNALIPAAQLVPPAGWEPRQVREAKAQQAAAQGQQPAAPATGGR